MRYRPDVSWRWLGDDLISGSPLRLFRLTPAGRRVAQRVEAGEDVIDTILVRRLVDAGAAHPVPLPAPGRDAAGVPVVTPVFGTSAIAGRLTVDDGSVPPVEGADARLARNRGPGAARNAGRALVDAELVAFVDSDVDLMDGVGPSWLAPLLGHFEDPRVGLVAPRVMGEPDSPLDLGPEPARVRPQTRVSYVPSAAIVVRVAAFDSVGGFDETLRVGEDVDLVWRLDDAGWICRYEPDSVVWHPPRPTFRARLAQHLGYGTSAAALALRHPHRLGPWQAERTTALGWLLAAAGRPIAAAVCLAANTVGLVRRLAPSPPSEVIRFAVFGHRRVAMQLASAIRREWFPPVAVAALFSRRARVALVASIAAAPGRAVTDAAYGCGVWIGMIRHRTIRPIVPTVRRWAAEARRPETSPRVRSES